MSKTSNLILLAHKEAVTIEESAKNSFIEQLKSLKLNINNIQTSACKAQIIWYNAAAEFIKQATAFKPMEIIIPSPKQPENENSDPTATKSKANPETNYTLDETQKDKLSQYYQLVAKCQNPYITLSHSLLNAIALNYKNILKVIHPDKVQLDAREEYTELTRFTYDLKEHSSKEKNCLTNECIEDNLLINEYLVAYRYRVQIELELNKLLSDCEDLCNSNSNEIAKCTENCKIEFDYN